MKISVNRTDIRNGKKFGANCPIALALKRQGFKNVDVSYGFIRADRTTVQTPSEVRSFMLEFDTDRRPDPASFELPLSN